MKFKACGEDAAAIIMELLDDEAVTQTELAKRLGTLRQNVNQMLTRSKEMKYKSFRNMAAALGYEIFLIKKYENERLEFENGYEEAEESE